MLLADAHAVEDAGAFAVVLEMVPSDAAKRVTDAVSGVPLEGARILVQGSTLATGTNALSVTRLAAERCAARLNGYRSAAETGSMNQRIGELLS